VAPLKLRGRAGVLVLFLITRIVLLSVDAPDSTLLGVNVQYAFEVQRAEQVGLSFYKVHEINRADENPRSSEVERQVEYPPLAILWMTAPTWFLDPVPKTGLAPESLLNAAKQANRIAMFLVDLCGFGLLWWMGAAVAPLAIYAAGGLLLFPLLYDRMDLLLGVLLIAALAAVARKLPPWVPLLVLAIAINFKLTPLVLVPLFVQWSARRAAILAAFTAGIFLPFFIRDGMPTLGFLQYHAARGLQLESIWSTLPDALGAQVVFRYGAFEVQSSLTGFLLVLSTIAMLAVIPAAALFSRTDDRLSSSVPAAERRVCFPNACALFLLIAILTSKVFSPQYLLWIVPLIALWEGRRRPLVWSVFLAACALTTLCYPFGYGRLMTAVKDASTLPFATRLAGITPLVLRNVLLIALAVICWRDMATAPESAPPTMKK
jgi:hypothetical protein